MKDYFKCDYCGWQFKLVLAVKKDDKNFCSHKCQVFYQVQEERESFPDYPDRGILEKKKDS